MGSSDGVLLTTTTTTTRQASIHHAATNMTAAASSRTTTDREFFTTPYKMRKFSEDATVLMVDLSSAVVTTPPSLTTAASVSGSRVVTDPVCGAPLSPNNGNDIASPYSQCGSSPTQQQQQQSQQGIPIPVILQPLFGLEFVPFVLPHDTTTFNSATVFGGGEALTDKLLEDLDVGCPSSFYDFYASSTTDPSATISTSPLPASTTTTTTTIQSNDGLDVDTVTSNLSLANLLNNNDEPDNTTPNLRSKPLLSDGKEPLLNDNNKDSTTTTATRQTQFQLQPQQPQNSNNTWAPTSKRRRNVFQRRRAWSFGVDSNNSTSTEKSNAGNGINGSSGKPPPMPGRRKLGLRFIHTKKTTTTTSSSTRSSKGSAESLFLSSSSSPSRSRANTDPSDWDELQQRQQLLLLDHHQSTLREAQKEAVTMQQHANEIERRVKTLQNEIAQIQSALTQSNGKQQQELQSEVVTNRHEARAKMKRLQLAALEASQGITDSIQQMMMKNDASNDPSSVEFQPPSRRPRAMTAPVMTTSDAFLVEEGMPVNLERATSDETSSSASTTSTLLNLDTLPSPTGFVFVDRNSLKSILQNLNQLGYDVATDESDRFVPTRDTEKALQGYRKNIQLQKDSADWPIQPWYSAHHDDILIWTGDVRHAGLGSDWPVCKARGLIQTPPRALLEYLMDSSRVKEYNKMSQGRDDMYVIQKGLGAAASSSPYDISGECKIVKSINKPRFLPFTIEMISLMHGKPLETTPGSYMMVYRSVFEDTSTLGDTAPVIRSEMLLGVILARPYNRDHSITEMTSITHMYSPGVPEMIARRAAPSSALNVLRDLQSIFK